MTASVIENGSGDYELVSDYIPATNRAWGYRARSVLTKEGRPLNVCERCGKVAEDHDVHHIDRNRKNCKSSNLEVLCKKCHADEHPERLQFPKYKKFRR
jgi:5-methylcytosine-specific restriction endonuclease McrA